MPAARRRPQKGRGLFPRSRLPPSRYASAEAGRLARKYHITNPRTKRNIERFIRGHHPTHPRRSMASKVGMTAALGGALAALTGGLLGGILPKAKKKKV